MTHAITVTGLDHIVLRCRDIEASLAFYVGRLGLEPERVDEWRAGEVPFPSVRIDSATIIDLFGGTPDGTNVEHFCLVIEKADLDAISDSFADSVRADGLFGAQGYASSVYIRDPDANTVELRWYEPAS
jgi:catechol 2,3-dioxygenase-like lactoylglutathione lyase family enzyme